MTVKEPGITGLSASWAQSISPETVTFDVGPEDISPEGYLVLRLEMENVGPSLIVTMAQPQWTINHMQVSRVGEVDRTAD